jgi:serine/threonine-protein kinase HipA
VDRGGKFILKPNPQPFEEVPANEALTMTLAGTVGIEVPCHGLLPAADGSWVYFIRRFDRVGRGGRLHQEDFAQLTGAGRETKYRSSLEQVVKVIETHCTFPAIEKAKLARLLLFCYLTGNEDMHLKNFSLVVREGVVGLSPAYDLLNTTLVLENASEESALPLRGKKRKLTRNDWVDYLCRDHLKLPGAILDRLLSNLNDGLGEWTELIRRSYLSPRRQESYLEILKSRHERLFQAH